MARTEVDVVLAFNDGINARDAGALEALMSPDHRFVDSAGSTVAGRLECVDAWRSFFDSFPDYRNVVESVEVRAPGHVRIDGYSVCSFEPLDGPARWHATVTDGLVAEWRVEDPTDDSAGGEPAPEDRTSGPT